MTEPIKTPFPEDNSRLVFLKSFIGRHLGESISPVGAWLNGKLLDIREGSMEVEFVVRKDMCNPMDVLHGEIAAAILDDILGTIVYGLGRDFAYTSVNLNCDFLTPAKLGDTIVAKGIIIRAGKNVIHVEGEIIDNSGRIIAKCASNLIQTGLKIPANSKF
jgi:acyl-coenzyme A thioesterase 13